MARLTGVRVMNFKAIGNESVDLRLAPITLLYGPNGAGKSTILHALHYTREVLERGNLDPDRTLAGGALDLGGFRNLIHDRDLERQVLLGFDFDVHDMGVDWLDALDRMGWTGPSPLMSPHNIERASVDLTISWSPFLQRPFVEECLIGLIDRPFASIRATRDGANVELTGIDYEHPVLWEGANEANAIPLEAALFGGQTPERVGIFGLTQALPRLDEPLHLDLDQDTLDLAGELLDRESERAVIEQQKAVMDYLSGLIVGPLQQLRSALRELIHIGPLREVPPRGYQPQRSPDLSRWTNGLAAWDRLSSMDQEQTARVDYWLDEKLGSGFGVRVEKSKRIPLSHPFALQIEEATPLDLPDLKAQWKEIAEDHRVVLHDVINNVDVEPSEIGVGVSQVVPIVVAALDSAAPFVSVEQPELHVHPRLQTELGDLFAAGLTPVGEQPALFDDILGELIPNGRTFLVETHSEHLVLRLLRRIRERTDDELEPEAPSVSPELLSVNYLQPSSEGARLYHLRVDQNGEFLDNWPEGFFAERRKELF